MHLLRYTVKGEDKGELEAGRAEEEKRKEHRERKGECERTCVSVGVFERNMAAAVPIICAYISLCIYTHIYLYIYEADRAFESTTHNYRYNSFLNLYPYIHTHKHTQGQDASNT